MPRTITFSDIKIKEFTILKENDKWILSLYYSFLDDQNKEWHAKRISMKGVDLTSAQKTKLQAVLSLIITKIKTLEGL